MSGSVLPDALSTESVEFRDRAEAVLAEYGEVVLVYYLAFGGGWQEWHLVRNADDLRALFNSGSPRSAFVVYRTPQLPVRGLAGGNLLGEVLAALHETGEVLLATAPASGSKLVDRQALLDHAGTDEERDVREWFEAHEGLAILAGPHPASGRGSAADALEGRVPDLDGQLRSAAF